MYVLIHELLWHTPNTAENQGGDYLFEVNDDQPVVGVHADGSSVVVGVDKCLLKCFTCCHKKACVHTLYISPFLEEKDAADESSADVQSVHLIRNALRRVHNKQSAKFPYSAVSKQSIMLLPSPVQKDPGCSSANGIIDFKPRNGICLGCGAQLHLDRGNCHMVAVGVVPFITYDKIE